MNHIQFLKFHKEMTEKMHEISKAKNHDYSGGDSHAFRNFTVVEDLGICSTEQGFLTRMCDKFMRIANFCNSGVLKVQDEKIEDTLLDLANYSLLFAGYIRSKKDGQVTIETETYTVASKQMDYVKTLLELIYNEDEDGAHSRVSARAISAVILERLKSIKVNIEGQPDACNPPPVPEPSDGVLLDGDPPF